MRDLKLQFVLATQSAFRIFENPEFNNLLDYVSEGRVKPITAKTLVADMCDQYDKIKSNLMHLIEKAKYVCITADIWTNKSKSFMGTTIHFFDDDLNKKSYLLAFRRIHGRHTHQTVAEMLLSILKEFKIKRSKVTRIITDGGSNFVKAFIIYGPPEFEALPARENNDLFGHENGSSAELEIDDIVNYEEPRDGDAFYPPETVSEELTLHEDQFADFHDESDEYSCLPKQMRCVT